IYNNFADITAHICGITNSIILFFTFWSNYINNYFYQVQLFKKLFDIDLSKKLPNDSIKGGKIEYLHFRVNDNNMTNINVSFDDLIFRLNSRKKVNKDSQVKFSTKELFYIMFCPKY